MIHTLFNEIFYRPFLNGLAILVGIMPGHDVGLAIIALTVIVRTIIYPITHHSTRSQAKMREIEPEINALKEKLKDNKEEQAKRTMELYSKHGVNPFSGCLVAILQIPVFIALYYVFWKGLSFGVSDLYSFVAHPGVVNMEFLGILPLAKSSVVLAILAGLTQFIQVKLAQPSPAVAPKLVEGDFQRAMRIQMTYFLPFLIGFMALKFTAAVSLYWTTNNLFAIFHEGIVRFKAKKYGPNKTPTDQGNSADHRK
jgi:YidC/Oxa1 family membrane protein insertase